MQDFVFTHKPVLIAEVLAALDPKDGMTYVDCTFGAGGHSRAILQAADCFLYAIDRDAVAFNIWERDFICYADRMHFSHGTFAESLSAHYDREPPAGILMDLGASSIQLDDPSRGFSFMRDGPLSMSMGRGSMEASDIVNYADEEEIASVLFYYGDETKSRRIARAIVQQRAVKPIETTQELARIIRKVVPPTAKIDPATKTFMALRMRVNDELGELLDGMEAAMRLLAVGGKLLIISFNASEDRIVKAFIKNIGGAMGHKFTWPGVGEFLVSSNKIKPSSAEIADNPRARSAGLRVITRAS